MNGTAAIEFAHDGGFDDVKYMGRWNDYEVYKPIFVSDEYLPYGRPMLILERGDDAIGVTGNQYLRVLREIDTTIQLHDRDIIGDATMGADEERWITVHPNGPDATGRPALIDSETGTVKAGMGGKFNGTKIDKVHKISGTQSKIDNYIKGKSGLTDAGVRKLIAEKHGVDPDSLLPSMENIMSPSPAYEEFQNVMREHAKTVVSSLSQKPIESEGIIDLQESDIVSAKSPAGENTIKAMEKHPFKAGQTPEEYQDTVKSWLPQSRILIDKLPQETAQGTTEAIHAVLQDFPDLSGEIKGIGQIDSIRTQVYKDAKVLALDIDILGQDSEFRLEQGHKAKKEWNIFNKSMDYESNDESSLRAKMKAFKTPFSDQQFKEYLSLPPEDRKKYIRKIIMDRAYIRLARIRLSSGVGRNRANVPAMSSLKQGVMIGRDFDDVKRTKINWEKCVAHGFHPQGTEKHPAKAIISHELGHQIAGYTGAYNDPVIRKLFSQRNIKSELSGYGAVDVHEMIAESFSEVYTSPKPREFSKKVVDRVRELERSKR